MPDLFQQRCFVTYRGLKQGKSLRDKKESKNMPDNGEDRVNQGNFRFIVLICAYIMYLAFGGVFFSYLELNHELKSIERIDDVLNTFLHKHQCVSREEMETLVEEVQTAVEKGMRVRANLTYNPNWNFGGAFLFAASLLTTIGYGDLSPSTNVCRMFCIIYAIIGIPMTATLLSAIVSRWIRCVELLNDIMTRQLVDYQLEARLVHVLCTFIIIIMASAVSFVIPAFVFARLEGWTYFESIYFCFITMTTVGLGDYTPGCSELWGNSSTRILYKISLAVYFIIGLSFVLLILELSGRVPKTAPSLLFSCETKLHHRANDSQRRQISSESDDVIEAR